MPNFNLLQKKAGNNCFLPLYYGGNFKDVLRPYQAEAYTLDEALRMVAMLKQRDRYYRIVRIDSESV